VFDERAGLGRPSPTVTMAPRMAAADDVGAMVEDDRRDIAAIGLTSARARRFRLQRLPDHQEPRALGILIRDKIVDRRRRARDAPLRPDPFEAGPHVGQPQMMMPRLHHADTILPPSSKTIVACRAGIRFRAAPI